MRIQRLFFRNIRNHDQTEIHASDRVNVFTGRNGMGKTSILEAISLCTLTRSFAANQDQNLLRRGEKDLIARLEGRSDYGAPRRIEVQFGIDEGKRIRLDGSPARNAAAVIGAAPTVVLFPDLKSITAGPPTHRRSFLDLVLSQSKRKYLEDLMQYRRMLKQRNTILANARRHNRHVDPAILEPWDEGIIDRGARIIFERMKFFREFEPILRKASGDVALGNDEYQMIYQPDSFEDLHATVNDYRDGLWLRCRQVRSAEQRRGTTLFGPHRDEFQMLVNGGDVRNAASQGQHKTLLIGLKVAEFHYLAEQCAERPIILLDDIFGDLDAFRAERVYDITRELAQVFITVVSFDMLPFLRGGKLASDDSHFVIEDGGVQSVRYGGQDPRDYVDPDASSSDEEIFDRIDQGKQSE